MDNNLNLESPNFKLGDLGIVSANTLSSDELDNWLGSNPDEVSEIKKEEDKPTPPKKTPPKESPKKEEQNPDKQEEEPSEEDILDEALGDEEEEEVKQVIEKNKPKKESPKEEENEDEEGKEEEDVNMFTSLTKELTSLGVFSPEEEGEQLPSDPQQFLDKFNNEIQKKGIAWVENFLGQFGDDRKELFNAIFLSGVEPQEYIAQFTKIEDLANIDLTDVGNQERVVRDYYRSLGWDNNRINQKIDKLKNNDGLDEEAQEKHEILLAQESQDLAEQERQAKIRHENKARAEREYRANVQKILTDKLKTKDFDGIPVSQEFAQEIASYLTQNKYQLPNGELLTEFDKELMDLRRPENHEMKVKLAMLMKMLKTDPTLSKLKKVAVSTETNKLFSSLQREKKDKNKKGDTGAVTSWFS